MAECRQDGNTSLSGIFFRDFLDFFENRIHIRYYRRAYRVDARGQGGFRAGPRRWAG